MSLKRPIILRALSRPLTIFKMHSAATILNVGISAFLGFCFQPLFGVILFAVFQVVIAVLTRRDCYFAEVYVRKLMVGKTKNLNSSRKGNYYVV